MDEEEELRVKNIEECSRKKIEEYLLQLENHEITEDDILAMTYASLCTASLVGFTVEGLKQMVEMVEDSTNYANHMIKLLEETMENEE